MTFITSQRIRGENANVFGSLEFKAIIKEMRLGLDQRRERGNAPAKILHNDESPGASSFMSRQSRQIASIEHKE